MNEITEIKELRYNNFKKTNSRIEIHLNDQSHVFWSLHRRNDFRPQISNFVILQAMKQQDWLSQLVRRIQAKASLYKYRSSSKVKLEQSANYESTITTMPRFNVTVSSEGDRGMRVVFEDNWNFLRNEYEIIMSYYEFLSVFNCNYLLFSSFILKISCTYLF